MFAFQQKLPFDPPDPPAGAPVGPVAKLQLLEAAVRNSPGIIHEDTRDTFLTLIWLALADVGPREFGELATTASADVIDARKAA